MSDAPPQIAVIVVAAGEGTRLGAPEPKAFVNCAGTTLLGHALQSIFRITEPVHVVVVVPASQRAHAHAITARHGDSITVTTGGGTRQESVAAGLRNLPDSVHTVLVHDAARPLTPSSQFERVIQHVRATERGAVPGLPVNDTIKRVDQNGRITDTVDRNELSAAQTPQGFPRRHIIAAYAAATKHTSDDAALVARNGHPVDAIAGDPLAFKITTPADLFRAEQLLATPTPSPRLLHSPDLLHCPDLLRAAGFRTGIGVDVHAFDSGTELWLAGLHWPEHAGLAGHSDGDVVCHAITDAMLSAGGIGDIGSVFGTDDPQFRGAHGDVFLLHTAQKLAQLDWVIDNIAVQIIGQQPKFSPRRAEAENVLSTLLNAPVTVTATTSDGLGFTGKGEGIAAIATALIHRAQ